MGLGTIFGLLSLAAGFLSDLLMQKQMQQDVRDEVEAALNERLGVNGGGDK